MHDQRRGMILDTRDEPVVGLELHGVVVHGKLHFVLACDRRTLVSCKVGLPIRNRDGIVDPGTYPLP